MSGNGLYNNPYYSVPTTDTAAPSNAPSSYPPYQGQNLTTSPPQRPGPGPLDPAGSYPPSASAQAVNFPSHVTSAPPTGSSHTYTYSNASEYFKESDTTYPPHDFTPNSQGNQHPHHRPENRWSFDSNYRPQGLKRFSRPWWRYYWALQVSKRRLPRLIYVCSGIILLAVWSGVSAAFANNLHQTEVGLSRVDDTFNITSRQPIDSNFALLFLSGSLNGFDWQKRVLNVDWSAYFVQGPLSSPDLSNVPQLSIDDVQPPTFAVYRDTISIPDDGANNTDTRYTAYRLKNQNVKPIGFLGISQFDTINTEIGLGQKSSNIWKQPEFGYPFDIFQGTISFVIANNDTITQTGRPGTDVRRLEGAILSDSILNTKVRATYNATCLQPSTQQCELIVKVWAERTGLVKFCVIAVFLINWTVTIAIFLVTGEALLLQRENILEGTDILSVCFTALFALPSVRSLLPGVPGYGCLLDLLGILPNVIIVTLCTIFFANSRLARHHHSARVALESSEAPKTR